MLICSLSNDFPFTAAIAFTLISSAFFGGNTSKLTICSSPFLLKANVISFGFTFQLAGRSNFNIPFSESFPALILTPIVFDLLELNKATFSIIDIEISGTISNGL